MTGCPLSRTELEILRELAKGLTYEQIALARNVYPSTIRTHLHHIFVKTGTVSGAQAVLHGYCQGWLELPIKTVTHEQRLLSHIAVLLDELAAVIEDRRELTREQARYLRLFDRYLRARTLPASEELRDRMIDQLHVILEEAGLDPTYVPHFREAA